MDASIRLVVGLGNPGREHEATRHNAGFWFVDALARKLSVGLVHVARFNSEVGKSDAGVRLMKPLTYMNLSGMAVAAVASYFSIELSQMLVVHDELDLPPGEAKLKFGGGVAGHNGLRNLRAQLATADFWRLRLGIGHPRNSAIPQQQVVDYVLKRPLAAERTAIDDAIARSLAVVPLLFDGEFERAMTQLHTKESPQ
jgi:PTH1 family peptidyl-tRNA hydrolase